MKYSTQVKNQRVRGTYERCDNCDWCETWSFGIWGGLRCTYGEKTANSVGVRTVADSWCCNWESRTLRRNTASAKGV